MKNLIKIISLLLTVLMVIGSFSILSAVTVFAADAEEENTEGTNDSENGEDEKVEIKGDLDYTSTVYTSPEDKISTMELRLTRGNYELYVDDYSGEVAIKNTVTDDVLFTNPYDIGASTANSGNDNSPKQQMLSQIILEFTDSETDTSTVYNSYTQAALRDQIKVKNIKNGIRVEYTIGREQSKMLVPMMIERTRFEEIFLIPLKEVMPNFDYKKLKDYYVLQDLDEMTSDKQIADTKDKYPITEKMAIYVFKSDASDVEKAIIEEYIKTYCPEYTYEELEADHAMTEYVSQDDNPPLFRMALEYTLTEEGVSVRLPANGIRFNESLYQLKELSVLPYMGAGNSSYTGYNFFPDGSGTIFAFEDLDLSTVTNISGKVYGTDFAYHDIKGTYQKPISYPVFGVVENTVYNQYTKYDEEGNEVSTVISAALVEKMKANIAATGSAGSVGSVKAPTGDTYETIINPNNKDYTMTEVNKSHGYMAIIEDGDALSEIATYHAGPMSEYNSMMMKFNPRPYDTYNIQDSISVGTNSEWTVVSSRKYVGSYKIKYTMLSDFDVDTARDEGTVYDASWLGMAISYRDYLTESGVLTPLTDKELTKDIPLYIETFGAIETTEKILSVPVTVMTPLTSFEDIKTMYSDLYDGGVKNINFKLTGYANGGMYSTMPYNLKFESSVGGNKGFQDLLDYADDENDKKNTNLGIFPDFDFVYIKETGGFDGLSLSKHAVKSIDDRYTSRREYSATQQKWISFYELAVSPAYFSHFYEKLEEKYLDKYENVMGISVSTLGNSLNSDFDEDEPYNREDSKDFTQKALEYFDEKYGEVMINGGNAYTWKYVDHIVDVALDSSRYNQSSAAVPFIGTVLHGSVKFAGEPLNMEGNVQYAMLKAIENGASPYFVLSYRNTQNLKEDEMLSKYYSVRYDIWKDDLIENYTVLNEALSDVQDKFIIDYEEVEGGERVPDPDELEADIKLEMDEKAEAELNAVEIAKKELLLAVSNARRAGRELEKLLVAEISTAPDRFSGAVYNHGMATQRTDTFKQTGDNKARFEIFTYINQVNNRVNLVNKAYEKILEGCEVAIEAIDIIAKAEKDTILYAAGFEGDPTKITNYDSLSPITREAIDHVVFVLENLGADDFKVNASNSPKVFNELVKFDAIDPVNLCSVNKGTNLYSVEYNGETVYFTGATYAEYVFYNYVYDTYELDSNQNRSVKDYEIEEHVVLEDGTVIYKATKKNTVRYYAEDANGEKVFYTIVRHYEIAENPIDMRDVYGDGIVEYATLDDGTVMYAVLDPTYAKSTYFSGNADDGYVFYDMIPGVQTTYDAVNDMLEKSIAYAVEAGISRDEINAYLSRNSQSLGDVEEDDDEEEFSKYATEDIIAVTYGTANGKAYKTFILNYNNYSVKVVYDKVQYTIPAYGFVPVMNK